MNMTKSLLNDLIKKQDEVLKELQLARRDEWKSYLSHQRADDTLAKTTRDEIMRILSSDDFQDKIAKVPELHQDWKKWLLDKELEKSGKFIDALGSLYSTQEEYLKSQARVKNMKDVLDSLNVRLEVLRSYG
jgi:hypothetical protein